MEAVKLHKEAFGARLFIEVSRHPFSKPPLRPQEVLKNCNPEKGERRTVPSCVDFGEGSCRPSRRILLDGGRRTLKIKVPPWWRLILKIREMQIISMCHIGRPSF
ncbi:hypothetical protein ILYODFUR_025980 [Ilyodon furcidens]|uniref:Uncharacterized protein n=1 Tax=Ilyodon furcidens TaxID=33524 RepID=A0ABV0U8H8_9TELE